MKEYLSKNYIKKFICLIQLICLTISFYGCGTTRKNEAITKTGIYFDTVISITLYGTDKEPYIEECFDLAKKYENLFSNTISDSDISKINAAAPNAVTVSDETVALLQKGIAYGDESNGSFDITIGALSNLWQFKDHKGGPPSDNDIKNALSTVNYKNIVIDGNQVTLTQEGAIIDVGGLAKGYIADAMKEYLNDNGITSGLINLGGNVLTVGPKEDNNNYTIGIQKPFSEDGSSIAAIEISDESVVTSGIYQRYFEYNGKKYHHLLDTKTGYPIENDLTSVTIINHTSVDGDCLSTTCFALGLEKGMELVESLDDTEAIFITNDNTLHLSSGMGKEIPLKEVEL